MDGILSGEEYERALNLAIQGCKMVHELQKEALKTKFSVAHAEEEEREKAEEEEVSQK